jgi:glycine betaine/choline ABC-type transport system substrate-binding protein
VVRTATLFRYPAVQRALARLAGRVSERDMRAMNAAVDIDHQDVKRVVAQFLSRVPN